MLKKNLIWLFALMFSTAVAAQGKYQEGVHYSVVSNNKTSKPTVTEVFSFYCPVCYRVEFIAKGVKKDLPEGVKFVKSHTDFMRNTSSENQHKLTIAAIVAQKLKVGEKINDAIFEAIHKERKKFESDAQIRQLFVDNGVDGATFDKAYNSFSVKGLANKQKKLQMELSRGNKLGGVPAFIVNGKYKLNRDKLKNMEDYNNLIKYLLTLD